MFVERCKTLLSCLCATIRRKQQSKANPHEQVCVSLRASVIHNPFSCYVAFCFFASARCWCCCEIVRLKDGERLPAMTAYLSSKTVYIRAIIKVMVLFGFPIYRNSQTSFCLFEILMNLSLCTCNTNAFVKGLYPDS